ncbi:MAG: hypothetical protein HXX11_04850 [Desulfuromonadales bacterium]|nr:hypothetical protein [Desulfuromonadales bacterium]
MKTARVLLLMVLCLFVFVSAACAGGDATRTVDASQVKQLQDQMLNNPDIMALLSALQNDPEMQALLGDPAVVDAVQRGDTAALANDPRLLKLLNNPKVQEIVRQVR